MAPVGPRGPLGPPDGRCMAADGFQDACFQGLDETGLPGMRLATPRDQVARAARLYNSNTDAAGGAGHHPAQLLPALAPLRYRDAVGPEAAAPDSVNRVRLFRGCTGVPLDRCCGRQGPPAASPCLPRDGMSTTLWYGLETGARAHASRWRSQRRRSQVGGGLPGFPLVRSTEQEQLTQAKPVRKERKWLTRSSPWRGLHPAPCHVASVPVRLERRRVVEPELYPEGHRGDQDALGYGSMGSRRGPRRSRNPCAMERRMDGAQVRLGMGPRRARSPGSLLRTRRRETCRDTRGCPSPVRDPLRLRHRSPTLPRGRQPRPDQR